MTIHYFTEQMNVISDSIYSSKVLIVIFSSSEIHDFIEFCIQGYTETETTQRT